MKKNVLMAMALLIILHTPAIAQEKTKIAIIILEEFTDKKSSAFTESFLKKELDKKGFIVVESVFNDIQIDEFLIDDAMVEEGLIHDDKKIKSLVNNLKAEMVIIGKSVVKETEAEGGNPVTYRASISATIFKTENMEVLGSSKAQITSFSDNLEEGGMEALEKASSDLAASLINQIHKK